MQFRRTGNTKESLRVGIESQICDYVDRLEMVRWKDGMPYTLTADDMGWKGILQQTINDWNFTIYKLLLGFHGAEWRGQKIDVKDHIDYIFPQLINLNRFAMVELLLEIPDLFTDEHLNLFHREFRTKVPFKGPRINAIPGLKRQEIKISYSLGKYYDMALKMKKRGDISGMIYNYYNDQKALGK